MALVNSLPRNILGKKQNRAGKPKSRGGCLSRSYANPLALKCKLMHRKCNELKPTCDQCSKSDRVCHYGTPKERQHSDNAPQRRLILPRRETSDTVAARALSLYFRPRASHLEADEVPFFDMFRAQMTQDFSYTACTLFWNRIIPRESMGDECVRWSVLSIGSLMLALRSPNPEPMVTLLGGRGGAMYQVAMEYHAKATAALYMRMLKEFHTISRRNVLINMFLLFLFELLIGNTKAADRLLTSSVELLKQKQDQLLNEISSHQHVQDLHSYLAPSNDEGLDQAERTFPRFQIFLSLNTPLFPMQKACWFRLHSRPVPGNVPAVDTNFEEFGAMWNSFITRAVIFVVKAMQNQRSGDHTDQVEPLLAHRTIFLERLQDWEVAILLKLRTEKNPIMSQILNTFYMGQKVVFILMSCCFDSTEMLYDRFNSMFRDIVSMACSFGGALKHFSQIETALDIYTLPVLNFVSQKCRDKVIRSEALDSFDKMTLYTQNWDAKASSSARRQLMTLEEESRDAMGYIPASGRYVWTGASWDKTYSNLSIVFTGVTSTNDGTPKERYLNISRSDLEMRS
ncbi:hypothetical protein TARUN_4583 [Trichoderma arundinaceum]|uniref:Zn(2)-C6 fungal-type domain-containing protein n=1 Tax=Trichoderma arundinaceum TaxID=490622 RepID=A0A395NP17_TRIAR|nr:hypothetical protein TARUN_4583 [Trichoderma arundinaceum]